MDFETLLQKDFEICNGNFRLRNGYTTCFFLREEAWVKDSFLVLGDYSSTNYYVKSDSYGTWHVYNGYNPILRLYHQGGLNWKSYY